MRCTLLLLSRSLGPIPLITRSNVERALLTASGSERTESQKQGQVQLDLGRRGSLGTELACSVPNYCLLGCIPPSYPPFALRLARPIPFPSPPFFHSLLSLLFLLFSGPNRLKSRRERRRKTNKPFTYPLVPQPVLYLLGTPALSRYPTNIRNQASGTNAQCASS
jgi:hypothetical protein